MEMTGAFSPYQLNGLMLRNRLIKAATYEGMFNNGLPTAELTEWHRKMAEGGIAMTTLAYGAVNADGRSFPDQMYMHAGLIPLLKQFTETIHTAGAAASIQLTHCGYFSKNKGMKGPGPLGPSPRINEYGLFAGLPFAKSMTVDDIRQTVLDFGQAAAMAKEAGFDAVEIHAGHGYLLSQFLSPAINKRKDAYGGPLENRVRFTMEVIMEVRKRVGPEFPILIKMNLSDGFKGGLGIHESVQLAVMLEKSPADALILSGGYTSKTPFYLLRGGRPLLEMIKVEKNILQKIGMALLGTLIIRKYPFNELFFIEMAKMIRAVTEMPLVYLGGVLSKENLDQVTAEGFELIAMGRALIQDPDFANKIKAGKITRSECNSCNLCIPEMDRHGVRCVLEKNTDL
jgi:2,4-dienoyl-CoA reductase-like NADH-dependent reductase (Old Yellow Enzyme family)